ncbi:hypothetical protein BH11VER1_BH11VER1_35540 [soil metagenome]
MIQSHPTLSPDTSIFVIVADVSKRDLGKPGDWAIMDSGTPIRIPRSARMDSGFTTT